MSTFIHASQVSWIYRQFGEKKGHETLKKALQASPCLWQAQHQCSACQVVRAALR